MASAPIALTRGAWVDLGASPCRVFVLDALDAAVLVIADTAPSVNALGYVVTDRYWQGFVVNGSGPHVWGRAARSSVNVSVVPLAGSGRGVEAAAISADKTVVSGSGVKGSSQVTVYRNGAQAGTTTANTAGAWSYTFGSALQPSDIVTYDAVVSSPAAVVPAATVTPPSTGGGTGTTPSTGGSTTAPVVQPATSFAYVTDESGNRMTDESGNYMHADDAFVRLVTPYSPSINRSQFSTSLARRELGTDVGNTDPFEFAVSDTDMLVQAGDTTPFAAVALGFDSVQVWHSFAKQLTLTPAADGSVSGALPIKGVKNGPLYVEARAIRANGSYETDASFWLFVIGGQDYSLAAPKAAAAKGMTLKWSDQFDSIKIASGSTRPNGANWFCHMPQPSQDYGAARFGEPGNSQYDPFKIIKNGSEHGWLRIRAQYNPDFVATDGGAARPWIGGTITSCWPDGTSPYEFANGVYRTKMLMPMGKGVWPAYWFLDLSQKRGLTTGDQNREYDAQEGYGYFPGGIATQHRWPNGTPTVQNYSVGSGPNEQFGWAVRDIAVEMTDTQIMLYIDDVLVFTDTKFNAAGAPNPALNVIIHTLAKSSPQSSGWPTGNPPPGKYQDMYIMCSEYWAA